MLRANERTMFNTIISASQLIELQADSSRPTIFFDTRFKLDDVQYGEQAYAREHVPGAFYLHLDRDLSSPITSASGRHPLPDIDRFSQTMRRLGVSSATQVIVYDDAGGMFAARLWWLLKWLGHASVAVLDGGWPAWVAQGGAVSDQNSPLTAAGTFTADVNPNMVLSADEVAAGLADNSIVLCDARAPERYRGDVEPIDPVAGHIPGAINVPFMQNLSDDKRFKDADTLRSMHAATARSGNVVHMCGSGVTACHNVLAYAVAGLPLPKLYAGSWSEWIRDPTRPVKTL